MTQAEAKMLPPGSTIGIIGAGQLGRMMAVAAVQLGQVVVGGVVQEDTERDLPSEASAASGRSAGRTSPR